MKTKLVYVLTCAPERHYIEQAHISIFSARYHNPDATIVLIVDRPTDSLFVGHRADVLQYVTEKLVVETPNEFNRMQSSRWLKTHVRNLIDGDFLFIDCDTIITQGLAEIDTWNCQIGAVLSSHKLATEYPKDDRIALLQLANQCGWNFEHVVKYFSSGVLYVKDTTMTRIFYQVWNANWRYSSVCGVHIDQVAMQHTIDEYPIVEEIPPEWNCIMYTRPTFIKQAKIIHFTELNNPSFLFSNRVLTMIEKDGCSSFVRRSILNPYLTCVPYLQQDFSMVRFRDTTKTLAQGIERYALCVDEQLSDVVIHSKLSILITILLRQKCYYMAALLWMTWLKIKHKYSN